MKVIKILSTAFFMVLMSMMVYFSLGAWDTSISTNPQVVDTNIDKLFWVFTCLGAAGLCGLIGYGIFLEKLPPSKMGKVIAGASVIAMMSGLYYHYVFSSPL